MKWEIILIRTEQRDLPKDTIRIGLDKVAVEADSYADAIAQAWLHEKLNGREWFDAHVWGATCDGQMVFPRPIEAHQARCAIDEMQFEWLKGRES